jgi:hypothetical protein
VIDVEILAHAQHHTPALDLDVTASVGALQRHGDERHRLRPPDRLPGQTLRPVSQPRLRVPLTRTERRGAQPRPAPRRQRLACLWLLPLPPAAYTRLRPSISRLPAHALLRSAPCADLQACRKTSIAEGLPYFRRQSPALSAFLENGLLPISNAHVERLLRGVALFRKNSLFVGSLEAGERYAALLTLAVNCALCGANPFAYFTDLFDRLAAGWSNARAAELMPQAWLAAQQKAEQIESESVVGAKHD